MNDLHSHVGYSENESSNNSSGNHINQDLIHTSEENLTDYESEDKPKLLPDVEKISDECII